MVISDSRQRPSPLRRGRSRAYTNISDAIRLTEWENIQLDVFCYGIGHMYEKWVGGKCLVDPGVAADKLYEIMPPTLRNYGYP